MKNLSLKFLLTFLSTVLAITAHAQDVDFMQSTGKIYVVVAVIATIFIGIVLFLIYLERKISHLEKQEEN